MWSQKDTSLAFANHLFSVHLEDAITVLRKSSWGISRIHLRELVCKVADVQLIPDHWFEGSRHLLSCQLVPVNFLKQV